MSIKIDPRVKRTRKMFEDALLGLMEEKEYKDIPVLEIAKKSTLNRATLIKMTYLKNYWMKHYEKYE